MKDYLVTFGIDVNVAADTKGEAEDKARAFVMETGTDEFADLDSAIVIHELDEHGDPVI